MTPQENTTFENSTSTIQRTIDLLLFFIQRDELDIYDIPIHSITAEFLDYIQKLKQFNIEVAGEFILVAATLMKIKAQMLLPRKQLDEEGNEIDPRKELVQKILEYRQYKQMSEHLMGIEETQIQRVKRTSANHEIKHIAAIYKTDLELENLDTTKLFKVFEKLLNNKKWRDDKPTHTVNRVEYSIESEKKYILDNLIEDGSKIEFNSIFHHIVYKLQAIFHFLAILELVQEEIIQISIGEGNNNFWISKAAENGN